MRQPDLPKRRIVPGPLTACGAGVMAAAGLWAPMAFLPTGPVAVPSAMSFRDLSARAPGAEEGGGGRAAGGRGLYGELSYFFFPVLFFR